MPEKEDNVVDTLKAPDLSELLSGMMPEKSKHKLVFVEFDPSVKKYYDHIGLSGNARAIVEKRLVELPDSENEGGSKVDITTIDNCITYLNNLSYYITNAKIRKLFIKGLPNIAEKLLRERFDTFIVKNEKLEDLETSALVKFLVCIARAGDSKNDENDSKIDRQNDSNKDMEWLIKSKSELYHYFHWLIQHTPQPEDKGGAGKRKVHGWTKVDNDVDLDKFPELAGLEYIFEIRTNEMMHARFNVYLETGEYCGQMIAFDENSTEEERKRYIEDAIEAARVIRHILPEVRQARYTDMILSGGEGGDIEQVLVGYLPAVIPIKKFWVKKIEYNDNDEPIPPWDYYGEEDSKTYDNISEYTIQDPADNSPNPFLGFRPGPLKYRLIFNQVLKCIQGSVNNIQKRDNENSKETTERYENYWKRGSIWTREINVEEANGIEDCEENKKSQEIILHFITYSEGQTNGGIAVIAILDSTYLSGELFHLKGSQHFEEVGRNQNTRVDKDDNKDEYEWYSDDDGKGIKLPVDLTKPYSCLMNTDDRDDSKPKINLWRRFLTAQLCTRLSVILEPRKPLIGMLAQAKKEGNTYREQYGTAIYGKNYLDIDNERKEHESFNEWYLDILKIVGYTRAKLTDRLYEPRGYRAIAQVIFDRFFRKLWTYLGFEGDPEEKDVNKTEKYTKLGSQVREALDFEDTLRLEGGYREHFVHSYHVFLLGIYLLKQLDLNKIVSEQFLRSWFLISMYHDIAYPIEKMEKITKKYLERLDPGIDYRVGDVTGIDVKVGFGKLMASNLFGSRLRQITDKLVDKLLPIDNLQSLPDDRKNQYEGLLNYIRRNYENITKGDYKEGVKNSFYQYCLRLVLGTGEHGILSSLLFDSAATTTKGRDREMYDAVCISILGHHIFDKGGKWPLTNRWTFMQSKPETNALPRTLDRQVKEELVGYIGWDPSFFLYEIKENNNNDDKKDFAGLLSAMLILCDTVSQWGRSNEENDDKLAYLRNREEKDPFIVLCYPRIESTKRALELIDYYEPQLMCIAGPERKNCDEGWPFVKIVYKCPHHHADDVKIISSESNASSRKIDELKKKKDNTPKSEKCHICERELPTVKEKKGRFSLDSRPRPFPDILQAHQAIWSKAQEAKANSHNNT